MMVNVCSMYMSILHGVMKLAGMSPTAVEIEPGTVLNIWAPTKTRLDKPALVFLHGFGMDGILTWQFQVLALVRDYAVYVPDLVFFGGSATERNERTVEFQAECMAKGLRKVGVERCTVVGLSYGGIIGFKMAAMFPELVRSLVVTCSVMALTESVSDVALERIGFHSWVDYLLPKTPKALKTMFNIATYKLPYLPNFVYSHIFEVMYNQRRKEKVELLQALVIRDREFTIHHYPQKIHLFYGEKDRLFDMKAMDNLKQQVGERATLKAIKKAGHLVNVERPFVYNSHLKKTLPSLIN